MNVLEQDVPGLFIVAAVVWGLLGWVVLPRLTLRRAEKRLAAGYYNELIAAVVDVGVQRAGDRLKASIAGVASGQSRLERGLEGAIAADVVRLENPTVGALLDMMPDVKRYIAKHPEVAHIALQKLGPHLETLGANAAGAMNATPRAGGNGHASKW